MLPNDIATLVKAGSPELSPSGAHIAYVVDSLDAEANEYRSQIWLATTDGSTRPRPLTSGTANEGDPCWNPDGSAIAFTARIEMAAGESQESIQLLPFDGPGQAAVLVTGDEGFSSLAFSPDGEWLAYTTRTRDAAYDKKKDKDRAPRRIDRMGFTLNGAGFTVDRPTHVYVCPTNQSSRPLNVTPGQSECFDPSWFPSSDRLAVSMFDGRSDIATEIRIVDLDPDVAPITISTRGLYSSPAVAPDGSIVAVRGTDDPLTIGENEHVGVLDPSGVGSPRWISEGLDRHWFAMQAMQPPRWDQANSLLATVEDRGNTHLYRLPVDGTPELVIGGDRTVTGWSSSSDGTIAFTASNPTMPAELFVVVDGVERQLTDHAARFAAAINPRSPEHFLVRSGEVDVDAWVLTPHDFDPAKQYPMLLNIHGGPFTQYGNFFFDEAQLQCAAGFVVVLSNPRGSTGREAGWGTAVLGPKHPKGGSGWGALDYDDLMAVTDTALEQFSFIDPDRLGVLGGSYGGYMTSWIVTHSNRFKAACSERAANNLLSLEYGSDLAGFFRSEVGPLFFDDPQEYLRMSPISYVKDLATPLLIIHSEDDLRCPVEQADQLFVATQILGIDDVEYYRFPGENHELSRNGSPTHRRQRAEIILEFFTRHLQ